MAIIYFRRPDFTAFADFCFKTYGDRVKFWFTINEPQMVASHGYGDAFFPPGRCTGCYFGGNSATEPYIAGHHLLLSHAAAVKLYREKYKASDHPICMQFLSFILAVIDYMMMHCFTVLSSIVCIHHMHAHTETSIVSGSSGWKDWHPA